MPRLSPIPPQKQGAVFIKEDRPTYRITDEKGFFAPNDKLYPEGSVIKYNGEPNPNMEPLNELAIGKMREYLKKLDKLGKDASVKAGKSYVSLADAFDTARELEAQRAAETSDVEELTNNKQVPLMGIAKDPNSVTEVDSTNIGEKIEIVGDRKDVNRG